jgi:hypothetical protein
MSQPDKIKRMLNDCVCLKNHRMCENTFKEKERERERKQREKKRKQREIKNRYRKQRERKQRERKQRERKKTLNVLFSCCQTKKQPRSFQSID